MKKATFKITRGLKGFLAIVALVGSLALGHTSPSGAAFAVVAPLGLVAGMKKKGIELGDDEEKLIAGMEVELNAGIQKAFDEARKGLITEDEAQKKVEDKLKELSLTAKSITIPGTGTDGGADKTLDEFLRDRSKEISELQKSALPAASKNPAQAQFEAIKKLIGDVRAVKNQAGDSPYSISQDKDFDKSDSKGDANKAAVVMTTPNVANASGATVPANYMYGVEGNPAPDVRVDAIITPFLTNGTTDLAALPYADKLPTEGTMAITAAGALKPLISFSMERRYSTAFKIAGRTKVSEENLDDIPGMQTMVNGELRYAFEIADQAATMTHVASFAPAFVAGDLAASTTDPTNWDVIRAAIYAVKIASKGRYRPNAVVINSADAYAMGAIKDETTGQYIIPAWVDKDGTRIAGVQVLETTDDTVVDAGEFIVGDWRKIKRYIYKPFTLRIGQGIQMSSTAANIVSDFESNMYTTIGEGRQHRWHYKNDETAFIKDDFATVKTAIAAA